VVSGNQNVVTGELVSKTGFGTVVLSKAVLCKTGLFASSVDTIEVGSKDGQGSGVARAARTNCFLRRVAAVLVIGSTLGVASSLSSCSRKILVIQPVVPTTFALAATSSSIKPVDLSKNSLVPVAAGVPTTSIGFGPGNASLSGIVRGPDGPVPGAIVEIERLLDGQSLAVQVVADATGRYSLQKALLGRIRIRAWRAPDLALVTEKALFTKGAQTLDIAMDSYKRSDLQWAVAPSPLVVGRAATVIVQLSERLVNELGRVVVQPVTGVGVSLLQQGVVQVASLEERISDEKGRVSFRLACNEPGPSTIIARLAIGGEASLDLPACVIVTIPPTTIPVETVPSDTAAPATTASTEPPITVLVRVPIVTQPTLTPPVSIAPPVPLITTDPAAVIPAPTTPPSVAPAPAPTVAP
jgi:hypothetical protein